MHEDNANRSSAWSDLPLLQPPRSAWPGLEAVLEHRRRRTHALWFAAAAVLAIAVLIPRVLHRSEPSQAMPTVASVGTLDDAARVAALMTESAQLEALVAWSREGEVESASAASLALALEERIERVDLLLSRPDADPAALLPLWQERVLRLRQLAGLQSSQHLLAANGETEAGQPVLAF